MRVPAGLVVALAIGCGGPTRTEAPPPPLGPSSSVEVAPEAAPATPPPVVPEPGAVAPATPAADPPSPTAPAATALESSPLPNVGEPLPELRLAHTITSPSPFAGASFGHDLAIDGSTLVVAATTDAALGSARCGEHECIPGVVYVFDLEAATEAPVRLTAGARRPDAAFGDALAVAGDRLVIGAPRPSRDSDTGGAVHVFERARGAWRQSALLEGAPRGSRLGVSVALHGDVIAAGAPQENEGEGAVYVFARSGRAWRRIARLTPTSARTGLGADVVLTDAWLIATSLHGDGVYLWPRQGDAFGSPTVLRPRRPDTAHLYGSSIAVDGPLLAVGHRGDRTHAVSAGAVEVFALDGSAPRLLGELLPPSPRGCETFGSATTVRGASIFGAAPRLAAASACAPGGHPAVHRFDATAGGFVPGSDLQPPDPPAREYGGAVASSGARVVIGAPAATHTDPSGARLRTAGAVYVFAP